MSGSWFGIIFVLVLAVVFGRIFPQRTRDKWLPIVFAYVIWSDSTGRFFAGNSIIYYSSFFLAFVAYAFLLSDLRQMELRRNNVWKAFLVFFIWFMISTLFGDYILIGLKAPILQLRIVLGGFAVMAWGMRNPQNMERVFRWTTLATVLCALQFAKYGSWSAAELADAEGRMVIDAVSTGIDANVNGIALTVTAILGFPAIYLLHQWDWKREKIIKYGSIVALLILSLVLIRTGSRNGGLALVALVGYYLFGKTNIKMYQKVLLLVVVSIALAFLLSKVVGDVEIRTFRFISQEEVDRGNYGSGRTEFYKRLYNDMTPVQRILGQGAPVEMLYSAGVRHIANCHSIYMQVLKQSGWVGIFLMLCFIFYCGFVGCKGGMIGAMGLLFFSIWVLTGVGESSNMGGGYGNYGLGFAIALCGGARFYNRNAQMRSRHPPVYYRPQQVGYRRY